VSIKNIGDKQVACSVKKEMIQINAGEEYVANV
jgi:hypothetical protein